MNIAVSACLLGEPCRYDGRSVPNERVKALARNHHLIPVCPEQSGGLPTPRPPAEIRPCPKGTRVVTEAGEDVTAFFTRGAEVTLAKMREEGCELAILKSHSPSCGSGEIYDGTFTATLTPGWGITASLLREHGYEVFDEIHVLTFLEER